MYKLLFSILISLLSISGSAQTKNKSIYDFKVKSIDGSTFDFKSLKGKKIIIVNTASECGNTPQYSELEEIYKKYKSKNVVVIGFPANNFGGQEPGSDKDIKAFCTKRTKLFYKISFLKLKKNDNYANLTLRRRKSGC